MATVFANIMGIKLDDGPMGSDKGGVATISVKLPGAFVAGTDILQLGGGGFDGNVATAATLVTIMQNRRRDNKVVVFPAGSSAFGIAPGQQGAAVFYAQAGTISGANITFANLFNAASGGAGVSAPAAGVQDRAIQIEVPYTAT